MPHQCLKCGNLFPDGSAQILRGCPDCRGTRFFYTEEALPENERAKLLTDGEAEIQTILENLTHELADAVPPAASASAPEPVAPPAQSAKVLPGNRLLIKMRKRRLAKRMQRARNQRGWDYEAPPLAEPDMRDEPVAPRVAPRMEPRIDRIDEAAPWPKDAPPPKAAPAAKPAAAAPAAPAKPVERVSYGEEAPPKAPETTIRVEIATDAPDPPAEDGAPETVRIDGPGRYRIDVKRLLEEAPIVVQKDGSYLIHLPSLFEGEVSRHRRNP